MPNSENRSAADTARATGTPPSAETLKSDAGAIANEAQHVAGQVAAEAREQVSHVIDEAQAKVAETARKVKGMAAEQKDLLASQIGGVAEAIERVAGDLDANNNSSAHYARMVADNAERLSDILRDNDVDQIVGMAQDFGRRQPVAFLAGAALLGFAASRFLSATARPRPEDRPARDEVYPPAGGTDHASGPAYDTRGM